MSSPPNRGNYDEERKSSRGRGVRYKDKKTHNNDSNKGPRWRNDYDDENGSNSGAAGRSRKSCRSADDGYGYNNKYHRYERNSRHTRLDYSDDQNRDPKPRRQAHNTPSLLLGISAHKEERKKYSRKKQQHSPCRSKTRSEDSEFDNHHYKNNESVFYKKRQEHDSRNRFERHSRTTRFSSARRSPYRPRGHRSRARGDRRTDLSRDISERPSTHRECNNPLRRETTRKLRPLPSGRARASVITRREEDGESETEAAEMVVDERSGEDQEDRKGTSEIPKPSPPGYTSTNTSANTSANTSSNTSVNASFKDDAEAAMDTDEPVTVREEEEEEKDLDEETESQELVESAGWRVIEDCEAPTQLRPDRANGNLRENAVAVVNTNRMTSEKPVVHKEEKKLTKLRLAKNHGVDKATEWRIVDDCESSAQLQPDRVKTSFNDDTVAARRVIDDHDPSLKKHKIDQVHPSRKRKGAGSDTEPPKKTKNLNLSYSEGVAVQLKITNDAQTKSQRCKNIDNVSQNSRVSVEIPLTSIQSTSRARVNDLLNQWIQILDEDKYTMISNFNKNGQMKTLNFNKDEQTKTSNINKDKLTKTSNINKDKLSKTSNFCEAEQIAVSNLNKDEQIKKLDFSKGEQIKISSVNETHECHYGLPVAKEVLKDMNLQKEDEKKTLKVEMPKNTIKQLKSLLLLINKKLKQNFNIYLLTDVKDAKHLSSAVFCFERKNARSGAVYCSLCEIKQISYRKSTEAPKINLRNLRDSEFDIAKYYNLFRQYNDENRGKFITDFTVYCNLGLNKATFQKDEVIVVSGSRPNNCKLRVNKEGKLYNKLLKETSTLSALADLIAQYVRNGDIVTLYGLMKRYHMALIHEDVIVKIVDDKKAHIGKFTKKFIEGQDLSEPAKILRRLLLRYLNRPISEDLQLNVTPKFGKEFILDMNPQVKELGRLCLELLWVIGSSIAMSTEPILLRLIPTLKENMHKLAGHILRRNKKGAVIFTDKFLDLDASLPGNLNLLRKLIIDKLDEEKIYFGDLSNCRFKINNFRDKQSSNILLELPCDDDSRIIDSFFDKFEFAFDKTNVDDLVTRQIDRDFDLIRDERCAIEVQEELLTWLRAKNRDVDLFELLKRRISKFLIINKLDEDSTKISRIEFKEEALSKIHAYLTSCVTNQVDYIETDYAAFSAQKVRQVIKTIPQYSENSGCMFLKLEDLLQQSSYTLHAFESPTTHLLVIEFCDGPLLEASNLEPIYRELEDVVTRSTNTSKKVLIIGSTKTFRVNLNIVCKPIDEMYASSIDQLTEASRTQLLQDVRVQLHQRCLKLADLMDSDSLVNLVNTPRLLKQLFKKETLTIGEEQLVAPDGFDEKCQVPARIKQRRVIVDPKIFKARIDGIVLVAGIKKADFCEVVVIDGNVSYLHELNPDIQTEARIILLGTAALESSFIHFTKMNKDRNIHLLKYESEHFVWLGSSGSLTALIPYRLEGPKSLQTQTGEEDIFSSTDKTVIICAESGAGKITYLYNLAKQSLAITPDSNPLWVVQIPLTKNHNDTSILEKFDNRTFDTSSQAVDCLTDLLGYHGLRKKLFSLCALDNDHPPNLELTLIFEDLDEILLHPSSSLTAFLRALHQSPGIAKIYTICRPNSRKILERELGTFAYELDSFTRDEKLQFLAGFWRMRREASYDAEVDNDGPAEDLLRDYENQDLARMIATPLRLKLLAEVHVPRYIPLYDLYDLYRSFVESCELSTPLINKLRKLSLRRLLKRSDFELLCPKEEKTAPRVEDDAIVSALLRKNEDLRHSSFAEYFVAAWLVENSGRKKIKATIFSVMDGLVGSTSPVFFDTLAALIPLRHGKRTSRFMRRLTSKDHVNLLEAVLAKLEPDECFTALLHRAVKNNSLEVVKLLLDRNNDTGERREEILRHGEFKMPEYARSHLVKFVNGVGAQSGKSAIELAADNECVHVGCELMLTGADVSRVETKFLRSMTRHVLNEISELQKGSVPAPSSRSTQPDHHHHRLYPIAEKLLKFEPHRIAEHLDNQTLCPRLLAHFLTNGRAEVVKSMLHATEYETSKRRLLQEALINNQTVFQLVNASRSMRDFERLATTKLLLQRTRDPEHLTSVLEASVSADHPRTFEYFVDRYPGGSLGFLEFALLANRREILDFLLRVNNHCTLDPLTGDTALHRATRLSSVSPRILRFLLHKGVGIDSANRLGESALCSALKRSAEPRLIRYLVEQGANLNAEDSKGMHAWCYLVLGETCRYDAKEQLDLMRYFRSKQQLLLPADTARSFTYETQRRELARKCQFLERAEEYDLDYTDEGKSSEPRLHAAVNADDEDWLGFLLAHGADVDVRDYGLGRTALHIAIEQQRFEMGKMLLRNGAIFDAQDRNGSTPMDCLMVLGESDGWREMRDLLTRATSWFSGEKLASMMKGVLPVNQDYLDSSPLCHLLTTRDHRGRTLLHAAADTNSHDTIRHLLKFSEELNHRHPNQRRLDVNARDHEGNQPLHLAARQGHHQSMSVLLNKGASFEAENAAEEYPFLLASESLEAGGLLEAATALFEACKDGDVQAVEKCLAKDENVANGKDRNGMTVMHWACARENARLLEVLIGKVDPSVVFAVDLAERTALHLAVEAGDVECAGLLLKARASLDTLDKEGRRPFDGVRNRCADMLRAIQRLFEDVQNDTPYLLLDEHPETLESHLHRLELTYGIDRDVVVNVRGDGHLRNSLLHHAARYGYPRLAEALLRLGAVHNARNKDRQTPLELAKSRTTSGSGSSSGCEKLLEAVERLFAEPSVDSWSRSELDPRVAINCRAIGGNTLLQEVARTGKVEEVKWLLERGASALATDNKGRSVLRYAEGNSREDIAEDRAGIKADAAALNLKRFLV